jgi:hypothetical protein
MSAKSICTGETSPTSPLSAARELASADEFLFAGMQAFVPLAIVLSCKGFAADCAYEWPFVCVGAEVGAEVVGAGESFRT